MLRWREKLRCCCCCCCSPGSRQPRCTRSWGSDPRQWWFARGKATGEQLSSSSRKLVEAALEAGAWGDAVVVLEGGRARSQPGCASGGISGASDSEESSAGACPSFGMGFLCKLSILLFSFFLILICMFQGWHVYV